MPNQAFATLYKIHSVLGATGFRKDDHVDIQKQREKKVKLMVREQTTDAEKPCSRAAPWETPSYVEHFFYLSIVG